MFGTMPKWDCNHFACRRSFSFSNSPLCPFAKGGKPCGQAELAWFSAGCILDGGFWCNDCVKEGSAKHIKKSNNKTSHGNWRPPCQHCASLSKAFAFDGRDWFERDMSMIDRSHVDQPVPALTEQPFAEHPPPARPSHQPPAEPPAPPQEPPAPPPLPPSPIQKILDRIDGLEN